MNWNQPAEMKFCNRCKHSKFVQIENTVGQHKWVCNNPIFTSPVDGKIVLADCHFERTLSDKCGPAGNLYEVQT